MTDLEKALWAASEPQEKQSVYWKPRDFFNNETRGRSLSYQELRVLARIRDTIDPHKRWSPDDAG